MTRIATMLAFSGGLLAQPAPHISCNSPLGLAVERNSNRLETALGLDRTEYLPGEVMVISISMRNNTGQPLQVFDPWQPGGLYMRLAVDRSVQSDPAHHVPPLPDLERGSMTGARMPSCSGVVTSAQPGAVLQWKIRSDQPMVWQSHPFARIVSAPEAPGSYLLIARYCGHEFSHAFRVAPATLDRTLELKLRDPGVIQSSEGLRREFTRVVHGLVFAIPGTDDRYLAIEARANVREIVRVAKLTAGESLEALEEERDGRVTARIRSAIGETRAVTRREPGEPLR